VRKRKDSSADYSVGKISFHSLAIVL
jgi:hypothetical protein